MSLTQQDREILLEEIKQIQLTLESSGRNAAGSSYYQNSSSSESDEESVELESSNWKPIFEDTNDLTFSNAKYNTSFHGHKDLLSPSTINEYSQQLLQQSSTVIDNATIQTNDLHVSLSPSDSNAPVTQVFGELQDNIKTTSSLSNNLKKRLKRDSPFCGESDRQVKKKRTFVEEKSTIKSDDGYSIDISLPPSVVSLPEKKKDQINMTNLYVERIFRGFRKNKQKATPTVAFQVQKFDSRNLKSSANLGTLEHLLQVNRQYQELLRDELKKVGIAIGRNAKAQDELMILTGEKDDAVSSGLSRACIGRFLHPYFKDGDGLGPPDNDDTKEKKKYQIAGLFPKPSKAWRATETSALEEGVYNNNLERRLEPVLLRLKKIDKDLRDKSKESMKAENKRLRSEALKEISEIKNTDHKEILKDSFDIDFFKISKNYLPARDEFECRLQWFNVIHPSINQKPFTKNEDSLLIKVAKKYGNHQWELISKELGTNRTPIQCLQRYQRTLNKDMIKTTWSHEDDNKLKEAVRIHGNYWVGVADFMGNRTCDQCLHRWEKTLNPAIRRGRWTEEEDENLKAAVEKYGTKNWKMVKTEVPGRTDSQCRERYVSSIDPSINWGPFTKEEDNKMMILVKKYGTGKWAKIATEFPGRRDHQIWRRYKNLCSTDYHEYRKANLWKKSSVMSYFLHRSAEKRDYDIKELDVNYSPSVNHSEARKLQGAKTKLLTKGYTEEEATHELARMYFDGEFSKVKLRSQALKRRERNNEKEGNIENAKEESSVENAKKPRGKEFSEELINDVEQLLSSVTDPSVELCSLGSDKLVSSWEVVLIPRPKNPAKRNRRTFQQQILNFETKEVKYRCEGVLRKYRQHKLLRSEASEALALFKEIVNEKVKANARKKALLKIINGTSNKLDDVDQTRAEVQKAIVEQDVIEMEYRKKSRIHVMSDGTSPFRNYNRKPNSKRAQGGEENTNTPSTRAKKKRKNDVSREEFSIDSNNDDVETVEGSSDEQDENHSMLPKESPEVADKLKTFTLLLQALHVDTNGVMKTLPSSSSLPTSDSDSLANSELSFQKCYPLSPNVASLRGFRSLLLHRRKLSEIVQKKYGFQPPDKSYQKTRPYTLLRERFRSLFIWPAFLATFIPKYIPDKELPHESESSFEGAIDHEKIQLKQNEPSSGESLSRVTSYIEHRKKETEKAMSRQSPSLNQFGFSKFSKEMLPMNLTASLELSTTNGTRFVQPAKHSFHTSLLGARPSHLRPLSTRTPSTSETASKPPTPSKMSESSTLSKRRLKAPLTNTTSLITYAADDTFVQTEEISCLSDSETSEAVFIPPNVKRHASETLSLDILAETVISDAKNPNSFISYSSNT